MSIQSISTSLVFQAPTAQAADATAAISSVTARQSGALTTLLIRPDEV